MSRIAFVLDAIVRKNTDRSVTVMERIFLVIALILALGVLLST